MSHNRASLGARIRKHVSKIRNAYRSSRLPAALKRTWWGIRENSLTWWLVAACWVALGFLRGQYLRKGFMSYGVPKAWAWRVTIIYLLAMLILYEVIFEALDRLAERDDSWWTLVLFIVGIAAWSLFVGIAARGGAPWK